MTERPVGEAPRTEAGRALLDNPEMLLMSDGTEIFGINVGELELHIIAIEREAAAAPPEPPRPDTRTLELIRDLQPQAVKYIRQYGFVFDKVGPLADDAAELDRWKVLAFSLYTDVVEASMAAERMLEGVAAPEGLSPRPLDSTKCECDCHAPPSSGESGSPGEPE